VSDQGRLSRQAQEARDAEPTSDEPAYLPPAPDPAQALTGAGRFARVHQERQAAATRIAHTLTVWRKGSGAAARTEIPDGGGEPLPPKVRARMEPEMGADLSGVRLHAGGDSATAAKSLNARAFTIGSDVHFNHGEFAPGTKEGDRLLAHELTHVVQGQRSGIQRKEKAEDNAPEISSPEEAPEEEADKVADKVADSLEEKEAADEKGAPEEETAGDEEAKDPKKANKGKAKGKEQKGDAGAALEETKQEAEAGKEEATEAEPEAEAPAAETIVEAEPEAAGKIHRKPAPAAAANDPKKAELDKKRQLLKKRVELAAKDAEVVQNAVKIVTSAVTDAVSMITGPLAGLATQGVIKNIMNILSGGANLAISVQRDMQAAVMNKAIENMSAEQLDAKIAAWNKDEPSFSDMKTQIDAQIAEANEECSLVDQDIAAESAKGALVGAKEGTKNKVLNAAGKVAGVASAGKAIVAVAKAAVGTAAKEQVKTGVFGFLKKVMDAVPVLGTAISIGVCVKSCIDAASIRKEVESLEKDLGIGKK
jgi:hypothetical protein